MVEQEIEIVNRLGLHARAASKLVHLAGKYPCDVDLVDGGDPVDAKSILGILMMGAAKGRQLTVRCDGEQEQEALDAVCDLFARRFDEDG